MQKIALWVYKWVDYIFYVITTAPLEFLIWFFKEEKGGRTAPATWVLRAVDFAFLIAGLRLIIQGRSILLGVH